VAIIIIVLNKEVFAALTEPPMNNNGEVEIEGPPSSSEKPTTISDC